MYIVISNKTAILSECVSYEMSVIMEQNFFVSVCGARVINMSLLPFLFLQSCCHFMKITSSVSIPTLLFLFVRVKNVRI